MNLLLVTPRKWGKMDAVQKRVVLDAARRKLKLYQELVNMMERNPPPELPTPFPLPQENTNE